MSAREKPHTLSRRRFVGATGALLAAGAASAAAGSAPAQARPEPAPAAAAAAAKPNIVIIIFDQERYTQYWPAGWADTNLPARKRLKDSGLSFSRMYINASMCSPSRATFYTGLYPAQHGLVRTLTYGGSESPEETPLQPSVQTIGKLLAGAGYRVVMKGKWHVSKHADGTSPTPDDVAAFGFQDWEQTTAGEAQHVEGFGGGCADRDSTIAGQAVSFLNTQTAAATAQQPFALIVNLVNPHDAIAYPSTWDDETPAGSNCFNYQGIDLNLGITLPPSNSSDDLSTKPTAQSQVRDFFAIGLGTLLSNQQRLNYVNFYAALHKLADQHLQTVLDAIHPDIRGNTVVIQTADHGEMGLSHNGLRQKMFVTYEEALHIPLIIADPRKPASHGQTTGAYASLVDMMPTLASIAGAGYPPGYHFSGRSLTPLLDNPNSTVQSELLFTYDDENAGAAEPIAFVTQPNHIRCLIRKDSDGEWKYARYFDPSGAEPSQFEMYHLYDGNGQPVDVAEIDNIANSSSSKYSQAFYAQKRTFLAERLAAVEAERLAPPKPHRQYVPVVVK